MKASWLHISDFHFRSGDPYDRDVVLRALVKSVERSREQGRRTDLVFATGDVGHSGKAEEYDVATSFFDALIAAAGVPKSRFFVIPGNHDVDRSLGLGLARTLFSIEEANQYLKPGSSNLHIKRKQSAFLKWYNRYFDGIRSFPEDSTCGQVELVPLSGFNIGILPVNSALFCQGDDDRDRLWIGRRCLDDAVEKLTQLNATINIALIHHPLDWLSKMESSNIRATLEDSVLFILRGHLHETDAKSVVNSSGQTFHLAAGATYQADDLPRQALYVTLDGDWISIHPIRYSDKPHEAWTIDPSLFPNAPNYELVLKIPRRSAKSGRAKAPLRRKHQISTTGDIMQDASSIKDNEVVHKGSFEVTKRGNYTELRMLSTGNTYVIDYTNIEKTIVDHRIERSDFERKVEREFLGHRIMLDYEYEHVGIPLLGGMTVFITKRRNRLLLDFLMTLDLPARLRYAWDRLSHAYRVALRLPYRKNDKVLLDARHLKSSIQHISELVNEASTFFIETARLASKPKHGEFLEAKRRAEIHLRQAETISHERSDSTALELNVLVLDMEMTISNVHKMMIYFAEHWEMKDWQP